MLCYLHTLKVLEHIFSNGLNIFESLWSLKIISKTKAQYKKWSQAHETISQNDLTKRTHHTISVSHQTISQNVLKKRSWTSNPSWTSDKTSFLLLSTFIIQLGQIPRVKKSLSASSKILLVLTSLHYQLDYFNSVLLLLIVLIIVVAVAVCVQCFSSFDSKNETFW